jgi:Rieske Fe-S protein
MTTPEMPGCPDCDTPQDASRRRFLQQASVGAAGLLLAAALPGCTPDAPEMRVCTRAELADKAILNANFNADRLHVTLQGAEPFVVSLTCSHKRCTVRWKDDQQQFHCPCHQGKYDSQGQVISGPPPTALRRLKTEWRGEDLYVLNQDA